MGGKNSKNSLKGKEITIGYHLIRGLAAPLRMMCYYKSQPFENVSYGADSKDEWFGKDKPELIKKNSCINLPYVLCGDDVVTQSNTCLLYLGSMLVIDTETNAIHNHTVLDQTMDLRNDLMKVAYRWAGVTKESFPEAAKKHLEGSAKTNFTKLEGFCSFPYMCGSAVQSGDFHVFEMIDQHVAIAASLGEPNPVDGFPKLTALYAAFKADPKLKKYFESDCYKNYATNNALFTNFTGQAEDFVYGPTVREDIKF
jgi:glutathione S-transferase